MFLATTALAELHPPLLQNTSYLSFPASDLVDAGGCCALLCGVKELPVTSGLSPIEGRW